MAINFKTHIMIDKIKRGRRHKGKEKAAAPYRLIVRRRAYDSRFFRNYMRCIALYATAKGLTSARRGLKELQKQLCKIAAPTSVYLERHQHLPHDVLLYSAKAVLGFDFVLIENLDKRIHVDIFFLVFIPVP